MSNPPGETRTATVTAAPSGRSLRIRPNRGASDAPARIADGITITAAVGAQVLYTQVGRRLVVIGGA